MPSDTLGECGVGNGADAPTEKSLLLTGFKFLDYTAKIKTKRR